MITLIIVDCQNDFITGTVMIKNARATVEEIKKFIKSHKDEIQKIIFTADWHPYDHCSFKRFGGTMPNHCIQYTPGACIEPKLLKFVQSFDIPYAVSKKGEYKYQDQIGAFEDIELVEDSYFNDYYVFDSIVTAEASDPFVVCGIGDSLIPTIENLIKGGITPKIYLKGTVSDNETKEINQFIKSNELQKIV